MQSIIAISQNWDGSYEQKKKFHADCKKWLMKIASRLGLEKSQFDIRSNKGGPAVLGDIILHSDNLYINMGGSYYSSSFYFRSCKNRKDFTGGRNMWIDYEHINDLDYAVKRFQNPL
jgi:hypothetical protein